MARIPTIALLGGESIPALGIGTWDMGDKANARTDEITALQTAVDLGMTVVDTAEMYGDGAAEELVAAALAHRRDEIFLVSKVLPQHATRRGTITACEASLRRLKTDRLDMYLLHWRGSVPLDETLDALATLQRDGKIRHLGVSNFDVDDMDEATGLAKRAHVWVATNQVLYNLTRRGIEYDLLPWCRGRGIPVMAYSPLEQGRLNGRKALRAVSARLGATPAQVALAWVLRAPGVIAIPKSGRPERVRENRAAGDITLAPEDLAELDEAFPAPTHKKPLEMI
ncbi:MAG TPA: aldo/keto reductase [Vicinamibacterales bacterium]|nr:aldo/keto reductase [Vicinamibacterales bacterium]